MVKQFIKRLREETDWSKIKDGTGYWSPGQIGFIIDRLEKEFNNQQTKQGIHMDNGVGEKSSLSRTNKTTDKSEVQSPIKTGSSDTLKGCGKVIVDNDEDSIICGRRKESGERFCDGCLKGSGEE